PPSPGRRAGDRTRRMGLVRQRPRHRPGGGGPIRRQRPGEYGRAVHRPQRGVEQPHHQGEHARPGLGRRGAGGRGRLRGRAVSGVPRGHPPHRTRRAPLPTGGLQGSLRRPAVRPAGRGRPRGGDGACPVLPRGIHGDLPRRKPDMSSRATTTTPRPAPAHAQVSRAKSLGRRKRETRAAMLFLAPDALGLIVFVALPMVLSVVLGFFWIDGFGNFDFIGIDNYTRMAQDPQFWNSARVTLVYLVVLVPLIFVTGLGLALLVRQKFPAVGWIRSALFMPYVVSIVVVSMVWQFMLTDRTGVVATVLSWIRVEGISFLGDPRYALG